MKDDSEGFVIGAIRGTHGVRGLLKVVSYSGETRHFLKLREISLVSGERGRRAHVESMTASGGGLLMKLAGVDSPEVGKQLSGWEIRVDRTYAAPLGPDEYYFADLCGSSVTKESRHLGIVRAVCEGGNGNLLEVEVPTGKCFFVPFIAEFIGEVDVRKKVVELKADWLLS